MALITFTSDFGKEDHYVAAVKAALLQINPNINIVDISHEIEPFSLSHGAYVLKSVFRDFPKGTIHLIAVDTFIKDWGALAVKLEEHFFVGPDNGILSLLSNEKPTAVVDINKLNPIVSSFPAKDIYATVAANLASGKNIHEIGPSKEDWIRLLDRQIKATKSLIAGNVIRVDNYGNLITNIPQGEFEQISKLNGEIKPEIKLGRERITQIHFTYYDVEPGEIFCLFNKSGLLEIGINSGNASELLGMAFDNPITIHFNS